jgi:hypothetical protein
MANAALPYPKMLTDPGYLYWAPLGTVLPTPVSTASAFSDSWPTPWVPMGMTESGSDFDYNTTVSEILAAEAIDPLAYRTTKRVGTVTFMAISITATNLARAFNGGVLTVTGAAATTITTITPPAIGSEVRSMIGFESLDSTFRWVAYQVFNSGSIKLSFNKAPAKTNIPWTGMLEKPATTDPWIMWTAGVGRA